jgi:iron complex outermembrane receptor protein
VGKLSFGARTERVRVESLGNPKMDRFFVGKRDFKPSSLALGALWNLTPNTQLTSNLSRSERAPKDYELFANGPHVATGAWEAGNPDLGKERSFNLDLGLQWKSGPQQAKIGVFSNRFENYISLEATGQTREDLPEFAYRPVRARFQGVEAGGTVRLLESHSTVDLELRGDLVRATNLDNGQPLPRIAPARIGATLVWAQGPWGARIGFDHSMAQDRVPAGDRATQAYNLWKAALTWRMKAGEADLLWYARLDNIGDRLAYSASSILTQTAPGKSPLPGRSLKFGLRASF